MPDYLFTIFNKDTWYFSCQKIDHAPLIILKFMFKTFRSFYFLNSLILLRMLFSKLINSFM